MELSRKTRILYVPTDNISMRDVPETLVGLGYEVLEINQELHAQEYLEEECDWLQRVISDNNITHVVTYDFIEVAAKACNAVKCLYIAWVYDNPQKELYTSYALYDTNYIFVFDKKQWMRLKKIGIPNVYHMPLAVSTEKVYHVLTENPRSYTEEISFVGQLYSTEGFQNIIDHAPTEAKEELEQCIAQRLFKWPDKQEIGRNSFHGSMPRKMVDYLGAFEKHKVEKEYPLMGEQFFYEAAVLSRMMANRERTAILNELSGEYMVRLFTRDKNLSLLDERVLVTHGVGFDKEVYKVYQNSKINLNITLHCIETGISQRVFDVLAAGGFLLTNYQEELEECFTPGRDLVVYHNLDELKEMVRYYLEHEEEREEIARNGQKTVWEKHNYSLRMKRVMDMIQKNETEKQHQVLVLTTPGDFERMKPIHKQMIQSLSPRKVFFLGSQKVKDLIGESELAGKVGFVDEEEILPFAEVHAVMKRALGVEELPRGITGWYYQQFLKMEYANHCKGEYYLAWDGDTVPCAPFSMLAADGETPYLDLKSEYHEEYFTTLGKILPGMKKVVRGSFIAEHMLFKKEIMKNLIAEIENNEALEGTRFYEKIIYAIPREKLTQNSFSEFETYGTYVAFRYNTAYRLREWHSFRYGASFLHPETMKEEDYAWFAKDFDAISFEKNQSVRSDHENLFQNKEYQSKLTARKMLEIVQETFTEGMKEEWQ